MQLCAYAMFIGCFVPGMSVRLPQSRLPDKDIQLAFSRIPQRTLVKSRIDPENTLLDLHLLTLEWKPQMWVTKLWQTFDLGEIQFTRRNNKTYTSCREHFSFVCGSVDSNSTEQRQGKHRKKPARNSSKGATISKPRRVSENRWWHLVNFFNIPRNIKTLMNFNR